MTSTTKFWGKYQGTVVNNIDPENIGRIQALVPAVSDVALTSWALPCFPVAGIQTGMFTVPIMFSNVWIEFEAGDQDHPIWTGCFYGTAAEVPALAHMVPPAIPGITLQTPLQNGISISDVPGALGGILIKSATGATLMINDIGIFIQNGKGASLNMVGPSVTINDGALIVV